MQQSTTPVGPTVPQVVVVQAPAPPPQAAVPLVLPSPHTVVAPTPTIQLLSRDHTTIRPPTSIRSSTPMPSSSGPAMAYATNCGRHMSLWDAPRLGPGHVAAKIELPPDGSELHAPLPPQNTTSTMCSHTTPTPTPVKQHPPLSTSKGGAGKGSRGTAPAAEPRNLPRGQPFDPLAALEAREKRTKEKKRASRDLYPVSVK